MSAGSSGRIVEFEGTSTSRSIAFVRSFTGRNAVLCSHGDVLPMMLDTLAARGVSLRGVGCAKGSIWRLETAGGEITGAAYTAAP